MRYTDRLPTLVRAASGAAAMSCDNRAGWAKETPVRPTSCPSGSGRVKLSSGWCLAGFDRIGAWLRTRHSPVRPSQTVRQPVMEARQRGSTSRTSL